MRISGVDLGVRKAAVTTLSVSASGKQTFISTTAIIAHPATRPNELWYIADAVAHLTSHSNHVFIEEPLIGRNVKFSMGISQMAGAVMSHLHNGVQGHLVNVKEWKKAVIGNGNADKHAIKMWLAENYASYADQCGNDQDTIDATCVALYGCRVLKIVEDLRPAHGESPTG